MAIQITPFTKRNFLIAVTILIFTILLYSLNGFVPLLCDYIQHLEFVAISVMIMMSIVIMLLWGLLGVLGGLLSFLTAMIFLYKPLTDLNPYYYSVLIMAFFLSSFVGNYIHRKISVFRQKYTVDKEKMEEDTNLIINHKKNRKAEVLAMGDKIVSLLKLKNIADRLSLSLSGEDIISIVSEETLKIFTSDSRVLVFTVEGKKKELNLSYTLKADERKAFIMKNGGIFDKWVYKNMKSLFVKDTSKDFRFSITGEEKKDDAVSVIIKPLVVESNILGLLRVDSKRENVFAQHELRILDIIGELAAVALENARLYRQTEELAVKDSLTGLYVHRYFMERLEEEVKRALRSDGSFALLMLDIDDFKEFNDQYGHMSGDAILRKIGNVLRSKVSAGDFVARYGGEEFVFLALNCKKKGAVKLAEEIREAIKNSPITVRRKKCGVTVSVGVAVFPEDAKFRDDIIWEADKFLYKAKSKGKDVVCSK
ncbi:MAG: sensor domain-containing diguanylate cyclase [Candidatus Omnitrophica bacterium]|nr:sensor domain-containing diguanylate cyclase [Candidatus Omnitrophota bacterium]